MSDLRKRVPNDQDLINWSEMCEIGLDVFVDGNVSVDVSILEQSLEGEDREKINAVLSAQLRAF